METVLKFTIKFTITGLVEYIWDWHSSNGGKEFRTQSQNCIQSENPTREIWETDTR